MKAILQPLMMAAVLGLSSLGAERPSERDSRVKPQSEEIEDSTMEASYPLKVIGRAGVSLVRTPIILGETLAGNRKAVSERGFFRSNAEVEAERESRR